MPIFPSMLLLPNQISAREHQKASVVLVSRLMRPVPFNLSSPPHKSSLVRNWSHFVQQAPHVLSEGLLALRVIMVVSSEVDDDDVRGPRFIHVTKHPLQP